jgi:hypothetical protein
MKKYKCIGKREKAAILWSSDFTIGETYKEAPESQSIDGAKNSDFTLFLYTEISTVFFVDKDQFEECTS